MAALPVAPAEDVQPKMTMDEAAEELYKIVEGHFDSIGLSEEERDERYGKLGRRLDATGA